MKEALGSYWSLNKNKHFEGGKKYFPVTGSKRKRNWITNSQTHCIYSDAEVTGTAEFSFSSVVFIHTSGFMGVLQKFFLAEA